MYYKQLKGNPVTTEFNKLYKRCSVIMYNIEFHNFSTYFDPMTILERFLFRYLVYKWKPTDLFLSYLITSLAFYYGKTIYKYVMLKNRKQSKWLHDFDLPMIETYYGPSNNFSFSYHNFQFSLKTCILT